MTVQHLKPFKFRPYLKPVIWGGEKIAPYKGISTTEKNIGESWEISGVKGHESVVAEGADEGRTLVDLIQKYKEVLVGKKVYDRFGDTFPLLIKIIDARQDLSVQVHPNDELAMKRHGSFGKTEMWYIIDTEPGAKIGAGLSKAITPDEYTRCVAENTIMDVVAQHPSHPGDLFFLPAGRIHSIGAGNLLAEIQQTSDITYRVYDFDRRDAQGNARELHTELAKDAIDYHVYDNYVTPCPQGAIGTTDLIKCKYFDVKRIITAGDYDLSLGGNDSFCIVMCLEGEVKITDDAGSITPMHRGETILVPAATRSLSIAGNATLLTAIVP